MKKRQSLLAIAIFLVVIAGLVGCDQMMPTDSENTKPNGLELNMSLPEIATNLANGLLAQTDYEQLLYTDEDWRNQLRGELLLYLTEEDIFANEQIFAVVGPPESWSISAKEINGMAQSELEQSKGPEREADWTVYVYVPFYSQVNTQWSGNSLGYNYNGTSTIGNNGCHLCCISMLYAKWGYPQMNPPGLNNWSYNGYQHYAFSTSGNGDLIAMTQALQYPAMCRPWYYISYSQIYNHLLAGHPVVAHTNQYGTHFVVIFAKEGSTYWVKDPIKSSSSQNQPLSGSINGLRIYGYN